MANNCRCSRSRTNLGPTWVGWGLGGSSGVSTGVSATIAQTQPETNLSQQPPQLSNFSNIHHHLALYIDRIPEIPAPRMQARQEGHRHGLVSTSVGQPSTKDPRTSTGQGNSVDINPRLRLEASRVCFSSSLIQSLPSVVLRTSILSAVPGSFFRFFTRAGTRYLLLHRLVDTLL